MITIEVIISLLILFMVIALSSVAMKQLIFVNKQQNIHEENYIAVLNIKEYIDSTICIKTFQKSGQLDSYDFSAKCTQVANNKNYIKDEHTEGNFGETRVTLYKITLTLKKEKFQKAYKYYKTVVRSR